MKVQNMDIEVLPALEDPRTFCERLNQSIQSATTLRATVAFWTAEPNLISDRLPSLLSQPDSCLCVDLHLPTDIDQLANLVDQNANVRIHLRKLEGGTEFRNKEMPAHLLHAKTLLFDLPNDKAELWIGSHNWTRRALLGINVELSAIIQLSQDSDLYRDVKEKLNSIAKLCTEFDQNDIDYYKWLQGLSEDSKPLIDLEGEQAGTLAGSEIAIFGTNREDFKKIKAVASMLYMTISDSTTMKQFLYRTEVVTISQSKADIQALAAQLSASVQRFALRKERGFFRLELPSTPDLSQFLDVKYYLTLRVHEQLLDEFEVREPYLREKWITSAQDPLIARVERSARLLQAPVSDFEHAKRYETVLAQLLKKVRIKVPIDKAYMLQEKPLTLPEKRLSEHDIITPKVIEKRPRP